MQVYTTRQAQNQRERNRSAKTLLKFVTFCPKSRPIDLSQIRTPFYFCIALSLPSVLTEKPSLKGFRRKSQSAFMMRHSFTVWSLTACSHMLISERGQRFSCRGTITIFSLQKQQTHKKGTCVKCSACTNTFIHSLTLSHIGNLCCLT